MSSKSTVIYCCKHGIVVPCHMQFSTLRMTYAFISDCARPRSSRFGDARRLHSKTHVTINRFAHCFWSNYLTYVKNHTNYLSLMSLKYHRLLLYSQTCYGILSCQRILISIKVIFFFYFYGHGFLRTSLVRRTTPIQKIQR